MLERFWASAIVALVVFVVGGIVTIIANLIGPWFVPLLLVSIGIGIVAFVFDTVLSWMRPPA